MLLSLTNIAKRFPSGVLTLANISLAVAQGEFLAVVGPSGSGKSTFLRLIAGLSEPTGGTIAWQGVKPTMGFVFQEAALMPWATVEKNIRLPLELQGRDEMSIRARTEETLDLVGLAAFAKSYPRELSGGMKMRVSLARALAAQSSLLLMDEPFAALDEFTRERLNDELRELWAAKNLTIVFVTHSIYESVYLATRTLVLSERPGRVVADIAMRDPEPRTLDFRTSSLYAERCGQVRRALKEGGAR